MSQCSAIFLLKLNEWVVLESHEWQLYFANHSKGSDQTAHQPAAFSYLSPVFFSVANEFSEIRTNLYTFQIILLTLRFTLPHITTEVEMGPSNMSFLSSWVTIMGERVVILYKGFFFKDWCFSIYAYIKTPDSKNKHVDVQYTNPIILWDDGRVRDPHSNQPPKVVHISVW